MPNALASLINSTLPIDAMPREAVRAIFERYDPLHVHNAELMQIHPAYAVVCDYRDNGVQDALTLKRLEAAINHAYDAESLKACNEGWGGIDGVTEAKDLIRQIYTFDTDPIEFPDPFRAMVECGFISPEDYAAMIDER